MGDFTPSCFSSSISVLSVPFESTGEGSTCAGYGLGGGARESEGPEDLEHCFSMHSLQNSRHMAYRFSEVVVVYVEGSRGELGESLKGEKVEERLPFGEGRSGLFNAMLEGAASWVVVVWYRMRRQHRQHYMYQRYTDRCQRPLTPPSIAKSRSTVSNCCPDLSRASARMRRRYPFGGSTSIVGGECNAMQRRSAWSPSDVSLRGGPAFVSRGSKQRPSSQSTAATTKLEHLQHFSTCTREAPLLRSSPTREELWPSVRLHDVMILPDSVATPRT